MNGPAQINFGDTATFINQGNNGHVDINADISVDIIAPSLNLETSNMELRFYEGANYVGFEAPALAADQIWVLPAADGAAGTFLQTDSAGNLSWAAAGTISGSGTLNFIPKFTPDGTTLGDSAIKDDATNILINREYVFLNTGTARSFTGGDPHLWIYSGDVSYTPNIAGNDIVIESEVEAGMTFLSTPTTAGYIYFQDAISANTTRFGYNHNSDVYNWDIAGTTEMSLTAALLTINGNFLIKDDKEIQFGNAAGGDYTLEYVSADTRLLLTGKDATNKQVVFLLGDTASEAFIITDSLADNTNKNFCFSSLHYDIDEEPVSLINGAMSTSANQLNIGGGEGTHNAVTNISFYAHTDNTTLTGTKGFEVDGIDLKIVVVSPYLFKLELNTDDVIIEDAGTAGATEEGWIAVDIGGATSYIRTFSAI
jgi:hypothetical protein